MNNLNFLYLNQKPFSVPTCIQNNLREKIKKSDFMVTDDEGTHRMIGLKYDSKKMSAPVITFVCMRHEMPLAKENAREFGKKIYYNSNVSAILFKYYSGQELMGEDYLAIAILYASYIKSKKVAF